MTNPYQLLLLFTFLIFILPISLYFLIFNYLKVNSFYSAICAILLLWFIVIIFIIITLYEEDDNNLLGMFYMFIICYCYCYY